MENFHLQLIPDELDPAPGNFRSFLRDIAETLLLAVGMFLIINSISARTRIESISMQPTLFEGDMVLVNKLTYTFSGDPNKGDVIVFRYPLAPEEEPPYIKRVIGAPGDNVLIQNGQVSVNGTLLDEIYIKAPPSYTGEWQVPNDALFVLGDNRNRSSDSHSWGMVPLDYVIGKAEFVYWPPDHWQSLGVDTAAAAPP